MITYQSLKIFIICICTSFVYQANAQIYVDLTATTGANDGTSWINAYTDFQDALDNAVANDTIWLAAGTYLPTEEPDGAPTGVGNERYRAFHLANKDLSIYGGFSGTETMLNQRNWQANITILSGDFNNDDVVSGSGSTLSFTNNSENAYHALIIIGLGTTAEINGVQVSGGNADDSGDFLYAGETVTLFEGAGLYNKLNSSPHLSNMIISTNFSIGAGGGMYNNASSPTFVNVSFSFNQGQLGAGMYNYTSSAVLSDVTFIGNNATFNGGGMNNDFNSTPSLLNVTFSDNNAQNGGGLVCYSNSAASLTNVSFINNSASQTGGGIFNNQSSPTLSNVVFSDNASTFGGGMINNHSSPILMNVVFSANSAQNGGGMYNLQTTSLPSLTNVTFSANNASIQGGGMFNSNGTPTLSNTVFYGNIAPSSKDLHNMFGSMVVEYCAFEDYIYGAALGCFSLTSSPFTNAADPNGIDNLWMTNDDGLTLAIGSPCFATGTSTGAPFRDVLGVIRPTPPSIGAYDELCIPIFGTDFQTACDSLTWLDGNTYTSSTNSPTFSILLFDGCDSIVTLDLTVNYSSALSTILVNTCDPSLVSSVADTLMNTVGCDSIVTTNTILIPTATESQSLTACDSIQIGSIWVFNSTIFNDTIVSGATNGCDSIVSCNVTIINSINTNDVLTACDSAQVNATWYSSTQVVSNTFPAANSCDSTHTVNLTINNSSALTIVNLTTCNPSQVSSNIDTLTNAFSCDSIVIIHTILLPTSTTTQSVNTCDSAIIGSTWYFNSIIFNDTILSGAANGCDSIVTYNLTINYSVATNDSITACDSALVNGSWYFSSQNVVDNNTTTTSCDSIHTVFLTIKQSTISVDIQTACDSLTWIDGITYFSSTSTTTFTTTNAVNCDSVVTLILTVNYSSSGTHADTACSSYTWIDGNTYNASTNTPTFTLTNEYNCDSTVTLDLTVNNPSAFNDMRTACDSMTWINGVTYYSSTNIPTVTLTNAVGCDSVITLDLDIFYTNIIPDVRTACDSLTWIDGNTYTTSNNTAALTLTNALGCDSIVALDLTINNSNNGIDVIAACDSITWINGITYTSANNTATTTLANNAGCDSIVTLNFSIIPPSTSGDTHVTCGPFTWINGITYNNSNNTAAVTLSGTNTCDSIVTLDLTVNSPNASTDILTACDSYTWIDGITYSSSNNTVIATLTNAAGCDSIVSLDLTINYSVSSIDTHTACDQFTWINGNTYLSSNNTASVTFAGGAANGCDSTVVLDLTLGASQGHTYVLTKCDSYTWVNGVSYTSSIIGDSYVVPGAAANGCDSLYFLDLTIVPSGSGIEVVSACESYTWIDGITYTSSTNTPTYTLSGTNPNGCDLAMSLDLTIQTVPSISITLSNGVLSASAGLGNYQWYRNGQLIPGANGEDYTPITWGLYTCSTSNGLCSGSSNGILISITSIKDPTFDFVGIYPNPVNDAMRIDVANEKLTSIMLVDITGKVIATLDAQSREFSMAEYARGMYYIELMNQDKRSILKIILK
ncbi:MAG: hypothetical protein ACI9QR_001133 [Flavobacteriaceae bacterium]|jgi:hypothetical protein